MEAYCQAQIPVWAARINEYHDEFVIFGAGVVVTFEEFRVHSYSHRCSLWNSCDIIRGDLPFHIHFDLENTETWHHRYWVRLNINRDADDWRFRRLRLRRFATGCELPQTARLRFHRALYRWNQRWHGLDTGSSRDA